MASLKGPKLDKYTMSLLHSAINNYKMPMVLKISREFKDFASVKKPKCKILRE